MEAKVRAEVTMTDAELPEGFDQNGYAWRVTLRYRGRRMTVPFYTGSMAGEPTAADVLECVILDASGYENARGFADWCTEYGYDSDSRKAFATYHACQAIAEKLRKFLGYEISAALDDPETWVREHTIDD